MFVEHTGGSRDGGVDVHAMDAEGAMTVVQVASSRCHRNTSGRAGTGHDAQRLLVTRRGTTAAGRMTAHAGGRFVDGVELVDGADLAVWLSANGVHLPVGADAVEALARELPGVVCA